MANDFCTVIGTDPAWIPAGTDLLHGRIIKAREVKQQLETLIARGPQPTQPNERLEEARPAPSIPTTAAAQPEDEDRARRMAVLAERIEGLAGGRLSIEPTFSWDSDERVFFAIG